MRFFCRLFICVVVCGCFCTARAGKINILDPTGFTTYPITTSPFTVSFTACTSGELPPANPAITADGCFAGVNYTSQSWSSIELIVPNTGAVTSQSSFQCDTDPSSLEIFQSVSCTFDPIANAYDLMFSAGTLENNQLFIITEDGIVPPEDFPATTATVTFANAATPEPPAWLLFASGMLCAAWMMKTRLRTAG